MLLLWTVGNTMYAGLFGPSVRLIPTRVTSSYGDTSKKEFTRTIQRLSRS